MNDKDIPKQLDDQQEMSNRTMFPAEPRHQQEGYGAAPTAPTEVGLAKVMELLVKMTERLDKIESTQA
jgi:hypothetical protein